MEINGTVKKEDVPICHGELMQPALRYMEEGRIIVRYECRFRHCSEAVDVMIKTPEEEREIRDSLDLFNYMWKYAGDDP